MGHDLAKWCEVIKTGPSSMLTEVTSWKTAFKILWNHNVSLISPEVANLCFLQSTLRVFAFRLCRFPVLMAGSSYPSSFAGESGLYRLLDVWLIRRTGTSNSFSSYCSVDISLGVFLLSLGIAKNSTARNVVFMYAKSKTLNFRFRSGSMNQLVMNLEPIEGIWFHEILSNNVVR